MKIIPLKTMVWAFIREKTKSKQLEVTWSETLTQPKSLFIKLIAKEAKSNVMNFF